MKTVPNCCYIRRKLSRIVLILIGRVLKFHRGSYATRIIHAQLSLLANIGKRKAFVDQLMMIVCCLIYSLHSKL